MLLDRQTLKKLSDLGCKLRRQKPAAAALPSGAQAMYHAPDKPRQEGVCAATEEYLSPTARPFDLFVYGSTRSGPAGMCYEICLPAVEMDEIMDKAIGRCLNFWRRSYQQSSPLIEPQIVYFDAETAGLFHAPLFLAGLLQINLQSGECYIRQLLAREYAEEPTVLYESARLLQEADLVVTFNGHSFDLPFLRSRLRYHRLKPFCVRQHLDLLKWARRTIGHVYGDCKLDTLERHLCCRQRFADIPGQQIPQAYHDYVYEKKEELMQRILWHNAYDLITLAELTAIILSDNK